MIQLKYSALFGIDFLHDYYTDKKCRDLVLLPSPACQLLLARMGLRFIATETGGKIYAKVKTSNNKDFISNPLPDNTRFTFLIVQQHVAFTTFSQLSLNKKPNEYYYFNNLHDNSEGQQLHLAKDTDTKKASDEDLLPFARNYYNYTHTSAIKRLEAEVRFADTGETLTQEIENETGIFHYSFHLQGCSGGRANLVISNSTHDAFYVSEAASRPDIFGVVEIFYRSTLPLPYRFINNDGSIAAKTYSIGFANRQTTWRYIVNRQFNQQATNLVIAKSNGESIEFIKQPATGGRFILASKEPLPLKETTVTGIRMMDQDNKELIAHLPNPSLHVLKQENNQLFSDIFITI